ncbi:MAG: lipid A export permease/ATP-binding protein MsbA [Pseudomonadota bacterium]|jgi:ATP-binding cassette, subfamily B, bacterial MsbA|uniref:ABC-type multidrug transport system, ATPase and permease component n=1 Tax=Methylophaga aminisulfidivorans MP TaxID=1026882 RepID=F5T2C9_9GAMM|nr:MULTISPECIES: lipid A export permease/ATP-binding protein MsbA [Methylophaga]EGL53427.1 ABC-type multidrug transport system, ATPase and permease component [Methylophaga aminisulfidivorans MP]MEC9413361.1 lipid A export permease/ATP-binding protein MsbA [Pseudomonadota bacterium]HIC45165.1 lipid A export permease/ATP-binding protein MsbA [Methylophaga sp.]HIM39209.1 lipid A export permease/ATP-binding protein MsbA [Methylophaga aminisulfidivorans]
MSQTPVSLTAVQLYKRLLSYVKPYWLAFVISIIAMIAFAGTETGMAALMKPLLDGSFVEKDPTTIKYVPLMLIGLFLIRGVANFLTTYGLGWIARNVIKTLREEMFEKLITLPASFYDRNNSGQLMSKLLYDVEQVAGAATDAILTVIRDTLTIIGLIAWMIYLNGFLSLIILVTVPFVAILVYFVSIRFRRISKEIQGSMGNVSHVCGEIIEAHREVKTFGSQAYETERFDRINRKNRGQQMKKIATDASSEPVIQLITVLGLAVVIYLATLPEVLNSITVGSFISFITAMFMLLTPLKRLTKVNSKLQAGIAAAESIFTLLDEEPEHDTGTLTMDRAKGEIEYRHVSFSYDEGKGSVLNDICFMAKPGQTIAFVGHSGSGKTTLVSLLARFYNIEKGQILIDGVDISQLTLKDLRKQLSLVNQQVVLFNDTIANNISYGQAGEVSEEAIIKAAKSAHAWEFIQKLPQGLQTEVGENGVLLSGGQRQRLAIARALLRNSPILILDEATSALDTEAERHIQAAFEELMRERTTLVIAHRLSTIEKADKIIVMHDGEILETGTHQELLANGKHYAELYRLQFQDD